MDTARWYQIALTTPYRNQSPKNSLIIVYFVSNSNIENSCYRDIFLRNFSTLELLVHSKESEQIRES